MIVCAVCGGPEPEDENEFSQAAVIELAAAIARGDCAAAAEALDLMVRDLTHANEIREWVAKGRASNLARPRAATPETMNV
nr:hypothetical protein [Sphingomonas sp. Y57]